MKVIRTYKLRQQAEDAANFLMSKGIVASIESHDAFNHFNSIDKSHNHIELKVQDKSYEKAEHFLIKRENGAALNIPKMDFLGFLRKK